MLAATSSCLKSKTDMRAVEVTPTSWINEMYMHASDV